MTQQAPEAFPPRPHVAPNGPVSRLLFLMRLQADFQVRTVHGDLRAFLESNRPKRVADIGCGMSPYKRLVNSFGAEYLGFDSPVADQFAYANPDAGVITDGKIPLGDAEVDAVICTEVLEHIAEPGGLIAEMHRILAPGGKLFVTVPWSARVHYAPSDFARYSPYRLRTLFSGYSNVEIIPRGTDITAISAKCIVVALRHFSALAHGRLHAIFGLFVSLPIAIVALLAGRIAMLFRLGSQDDPVGYTILATR